MSTMEQAKPAPARTVEGGGTGVTRWWRDTRGFVTQVRDEMRRVTWPSRREVQATTIVVIIVSAFFGVYIWGIDLVLEMIVNFVFRLFGAAV